MVTITLVRQKKKFFNVHTLVKLFFKTINFKKKIIITKNIFGKEKKIILLNSNKSLKN